MSYDDLAPILADGSNPVMIRRAFERLDARISRLRALFTGSISYPVQVESLDIGTLTGLLKGTDGAVAVAGADTDYQQPVGWGDGLQYTAPTASVDLKASGGLKITTTEIEVDEANVDHDNLTNFLATEHFLQTAIVNVSTALSTGLLTVTTGTGALGSTANNTSNWDAACTHASSDGTDHGYIDQDLQTSASPTFAVVILASLASDPGSPADGTIWYRSDTDEFRVRINGATKVLGVTEP